MSEELQQRIERLERTNRRWKRLALGLIAALVIVFGLGAVMSFSLARQAAAEAAQAEAAMREAQRAEQLARHEAAQQAERLEMELRRKQP